ncbi:MAG: ABC transporter permease subunit [Actinobacteria bacterium]|nr:ABC transporter permease subunit [Actinomycetota bacterium]
MTVVSEVVASTPVQTAPAEPGASRRMRRATDAEWIKLRSVRSTVAALCIVVVGVVGVGALICAIRAARWDQVPLDQRLRLDPTNHSLTGWFLGQLVAGVIGVLAVTSEYGSGLIATTFAAVPRRRTVLAAKAIVVASVVLIVATVTSFAAFFLGQALMSSTGAQASLGQPGVTRAVIGAALYVTTIALLGVGLGGVLRSTAAATSALFGLLFVPPILAEAFPPGWRDAIERWAPMNAGSRMLFVRHASNTVGPWTGLAVIASCAAAALAAAAWLIVHRDA